MENVNTDNFIDDVFATVTVVVSFGKNFFLISKNSGGAWAPPPLPFPLLRAWG